MQVSKFFNPKTIAVIGASNDPAKVGYALVSNLKSEYRTVIPVSLSADEIQGLPAIRSILLVPYAVDLALIAVPAQAVPKVLEECGKKRVGAAIIISSGFKESGEEGLKLERKVAALSKKFRLPVLGPNCLGVMDVQNGLNATFTSTKPDEGGVSFLSQSGATGAAFIDWAAKNGVGVSKFVSLGNEASLTELDFLEYVRKDTGTTSILLYLEKVTDGKRFLDLVKRITEHKPVAILKAGRSARGRAAALSHTGSLAPEDAVFTSACRENGAILLDSLGELLDVSKLFHMGISKPLRNIVILTNGGGPSIIAADAIDLSPRLSLATFDAKTTLKLKAALPPMASLGNPVDILGDATGERYSKALEIISGAKGVDAVLAMLTPQSMTDAAEIARALSVSRAKMPVIPVFLGSGAVENGVEVLRHEGLMDFEFPENAIRALEALAGGWPKKKTALLPSSKSARGNDIMEFERTSALLKKHHIGLEGSLIRNKRDLAKTVLRQGQTYVLKLVSPEFTHKSDTGLMALNLKDIGEIEHAFDSLIKKAKKANPKCHIEGTLLQEMRRGKEVILGMKRDPIFGPVVLFGLGGIFAEIMKDTTLRISPIDEAEALEMMNEIKGIEILTGARGEKPVNLKALASLIAKLSKLALANPKIAAIDLNPVIADEKNAHIVDARIILR